MTSVARNMLWCAAIAVVCGVPVITHAQLASPQANVPPSSTAPHGLVDRHKHVNDLALQSRHGDLAATAELGQNIFSVVAVPAEVANAFHLTQRVTQAETDYRHGAHTAVHEATLVKAHNNFVKSLQLPEWASTNVDEVRMVHMDFALAYPELLADHASIDKNGSLSLLSDDLSPAQVMFLETSLLYQKLHNPKFQVTEAERAKGVTQTLSPSVRQDRQNYMGQISRGKFDNVGIFDLNHAIDSLFSDLGMSNSLRSEFDQPDLLSALKVGKESK